MLGGVLESMGVHTKSGSAEPGARDLLFGGVQFRLGVHTPQWGPRKITDYASSTALSCSLCSMIYKFYSAPELLLLLLLHLQQQ
jgi:hypothetical protein